MGIKSSRFTSIQKWTLLSTILASSLVFIDSTALNIALPALQKDLGITGTELLWVINGYALFLSALLLVGGSLGDLYGRNKVFLIGLGIFFHLFLNMWNITKSTSINYCTSLSGCRRSTINTG